MEPIEAADLDDLVIEKFESGLRGRILRAGDPDYDAARRHYNALINKHPALIVHNVPELPTSSTLSTLPARIASSWLCAAAATTLRGEHLSTAAWSLTSPP
jgi:hypothetical protein